MRKSRAAVAAFTTMTLLGAVTSLGSARASATGVGTSQVSTSVLDVQLGDDGAVLGIRLLGDDARATIDPKVAAGAAHSRITPVAVSSETVTALNKSSGVKESKQPGGEADVAVGSVNLSEPAPGVTVPSAVLSGTLGVANLASEAAADQAKAAIEAKLTNAVAAGGLLSVDGITSTVAGQALATESSSVRSVKADKVVVLDLGALLAGLNILITDLPLPVVADLLDTLETTVGTLTGAQVEAAVEELQVAIDAVQAEIDGLEALSALPGTVEDTADTLNTIGATLGVGDLLTDDTVTDVTAITDPAAQLDAVIDELQLVVDDLTDDLADLLDEIVATLDGLALLTVNTVEVSVTTKAADTEGSSVADVTAKIGSIEVGGKELPGVNLIDALSTIDATLDNVDTIIENSLKTVDSRLGSLVDVAVFERRSGHGVSTADGYTKAVDGITALSVAITPPAELADIITTITGTAGSLGDLLTSVGSTLPTLDAAMRTLTTQTNTSSAGALGDGGTVRLASIDNSADFAPQLTTVPGGGTGTGTGTESPRTSLAATGANSTIPLTALAMLLIALGLGFREWVRMPAPRRSQG